MIHVWSLFVPPEARMEDMQSECHALPLQLLCCHNYLFIYMLNRLSKFLDNKRQFWRDSDSAEVLNPGRRDSLRPLLDLAALTLYWSQNLHWSLCVHMYDLFLFWPNCTCLFTTKLASNYKRACLWKKQTIQHCDIKRVCESVWLKSQWEGKCIIVYYNYVCVWERNGRSSTACLVFLTKFWIVWARSLSISPLIRPSPPWLYSVASQLYCCFNLVSLLDEITWALSCIFTIRILLIPFRQSVWTPSHPSP